VTMMLMLIPILISILIQKGVSGGELALAAAARLVAAAAVAGLWQGAVLAAGVGLALRAIPRTTATLRFAVWLAVLALAAGLPWVHFVAVGTGSAGAGNAVARSGGVRLGAGWSLGIAGVWLAMAAVRLGRLAVEGARLRAVWREAKPVAAGAEVARLLESVPMRRVEMCASESARVDRPSVIGFFAPRILIPSWLLEQLTGPDAGAAAEQELVQIVLHEVEHLRRGDDWLNLVQKLSVAVFPLNPALVWIERRLCRERELACDDGVLRVTGAPRSYATCLTTLAERSLERRESERRELERRSEAALALGALGPGAFGTRSELSRRVYRILNRQPALRPVWAGALCVALTAGLGVGAVELARSPELVSFAAPEAQPRDLARSLPQMPVGAMARGGYGARYQDVVFRGAAASMPASMPVGGLGRKRAVRVRSHRKVPQDQGVQGRTVQGLGVRQVAAVRMLSMAETETPEFGAAQIPAQPVAVDTVARMDSGPQVGSGVDSQAGVGMGSQSGSQVKEVRSAQRGGGPEGQWVVITSFSVGADRPQMILRLSTRPDGQVVSAQYAAVPTGMGWLIVQL
jgi:hypothetical protein